MLSVHRSVPDHRADDAGRAGLPDISFVIPRKRLWLTLAVPFAAAGCAGAKSRGRSDWSRCLSRVESGVHPSAGAGGQGHQMAADRRMILGLGGLLPIAASSIPEWRGETHGGLRHPAAGSHLRRTRGSPSSRGCWAVVGFAWLLVLLGRGFMEAERRWLVHRIIVGIALLATLAVVFDRYGIQSPVLAARMPLPLFGPFPNRNNLGGLLAMGAVADDRGG